MSATESHGAGSKEVRLRAHFTAKVVGGLGRASSAESGMCSSAVAFAVPHSLP
ncbi:MAG: hypothetical protein JXA58_02825 [Dehalococcoidia bacterium]|nr:hypothetical protein [Dehalococcoidia bacterium]